MKKSTLVLVIISLFSLSLMKSNDDNVEPCGEDFFLMNGSKWVYHNFDKKGNLSYIETVFLDTVLFFDDRTEFILENSMEYPNTQTTETNQNYQNLNKVKYICKDGKVSQDISFMYSEQDTMANFSNENVQLYYPTDFEQGTVLPDVHYSLTLNNKQIAEYNATNRLVTNLVTMDVKEFSFDCALVSSNIHTKVYGINFYTTNKEWYSPEYGIVKTEIYNKKGKLKSKRVLVDFEK